jgi:hypothetical protein
MCVLYSLWKLTGYSNRDLLFKSVNTERDGRSPLINSPFPTYYYLLINRSSSLYLKRRDLRGQSTTYVRIYGYSPTTPEDLSMQYL